MERQPAEGGRDQGGTYEKEAQSRPVGGNQRAPALGGGVDLMVGPISTKFEEEDEESDEDSEEEEESVEKVSVITFYVSVHIHHICDYFLFFTISILYISFFYLSLPLSFFYLSLPLSFSG